MRPKRVTIECTKIEGRIWIGVYLDGHLAQFLEDSDAENAEDLHLRTEYLEGEWCHLTPRQVADKLWPKRNQTFAERKRQRPR